MEKRRSFCRFCGTNCAVIATVEDGEITAVCGDPDDPVTQGYICTKGASLGHFHHHPARLNHPTMLRGGGQVRVEWTEALDDISARMRTIVERYGPSAIGAYGGTPAVPCASINVWRGFMAALGSPSVYSTVSVDVPCIPLLSERITGNPMIASQPDPDACMTILIGINPVVSHGHVYFLPAPKAQLRRWAEQGELWVVDPRRSESAEAATRHLAIWPGSEYALLGHAVRALLREGADWDFLERYVSGVDAIRAAVERFTLEDAAAATRLSPEEITDFVSAIRKAGRIAVHCGTGVSMGRNANAATLLHWALHAVTGSLDRKGGAYFNPGFARNLSEHGWTAVNTSGPGPASRPDLPSRLGEYPCAALVDEIEAGNLRGLFVFAGNPLIALPDTQRLVRALGKLDFLVMMDVVETASTLFATHLLPTSGQLEMADVVLWDFMNPAEYSRYAPRVVEPAFERRPIWWILRELSRRLGIDGGIDDAASHDDDVMRPMLNSARASFDVIKANPVAQMSEGRTYGWMHRHLPSGRWNLEVPEVLDQLAKACVETADFLLIPHRQKNKLNGQMSDGIANPRRPDKASISMHPADALLFGLHEGGRARVSTTKGMLEAPVRFDSRYRRGVVSVPHGFGHINVNVLTDARSTDPLSGMVQLGGIPIQIEKAEHAVV
ncbi:molybdopterin-containing oxidoreductase family protein [Sphingosinicella xenopeptidilytica]|uniref:Molybdopterin-dependent oxidoreductase n=1 Tax=Sphingosinicella xenopeptidilytica TaxID=364098 RepID=A0ABW3C2H4_SPHXN